MLKQRVITALILAPLVLAATFMFALFEFKLFIAAVITLAAWEWANLAGLKDSVARIGYAVAILAILIAMIYLAVPALPVLIVALLFWCLALFWVITFPSSQGQWQGVNARALMGTLVLIPAWSGLVELKAMAAGNAWLLLLLLLVWGADVGAYFAGKTWGNRKLAARVSPGKTWAGCYGGLVSSLLVALIFGWLVALDATQMVALLLVCLITAVVSVLGDLLESMLKRHRGIKDSSQLLPGHGGVMDRIDSLTAAAPLFTLGLILFELAQVAVV
ncbi:MAG: phosphatidate cytidylyltransferase [Motiliproteus sp.]|jgi:phosphatidate cytidylyltransferase